MSTTVHGRAHGTPAGHSGSSDPEGAGPRADARLGYFSAVEANFRWGAQRAARFALPGAAASGTAGLDSFRVALHGRQSSSALLFTQPQRSSPPGKRNRRLTAVHRS